MMETLLCSLVAQVDLARVELDLGCARAPLYRRLVPHSRENDTEQDGRENEFTSCDTIYRNVCAFHGTVVVVTLWRSCRLLQHQHLLRQQLLLPIFDHRIELSV